MTVAIEIGGGWVRPGRFRSRWMRRYWIGPVALTVMRGDLYDMRERARRGETDWRQS